MSSAMTDPTALRQSNKLATLDGATRALESLVATILVLGQKYLPIYDYDDDDVKKCVGEVIFNTDPLLINNILDLDLSIRITGYRSPKQLLLLHVFDTNQTNSEPTLLLLVSAAARFGWLLCMLFAGGGFNRFTLSAMRHASS
ncbi:hypothetical protein ACHAWU_008288 [Discostella pseudostelligera]|uniref:Uncharacterized protein n=1 Tax=Discostella pseudostelligera TaxID=259834 RepID=A0ABD3M786_9STRA